MGVCSLLHHRDFKSQSHRGYRGAQRRSDVAVQRCSLQPSPCNFQSSCASSPRAPTIAPLPVRAQRRSDVAVQRCSLQPSPCNFQPSYASSPCAPTIAPLPVRAQRRSDVAVQRCSLQPSPCNFQPSCASSPRAPTIAPLPVRAQRRSDVAVQRCSLQPSPCNFQSSCASSPRAPTIAPLPVRAQRRCAPTSSYDPAPLASRLSRSLPRASLAPCLAPLSLLASRLRQTDIIADHADASAIEHPMRSASSNLVS
jgi:hypothetical protein